MGFNLYLFFVTSWFLHLGTRIPLLGLIRFDLILVAVLAILALLGRAHQLQSPTTDTDRWLRVLIIYSIVTIPLVEWPGSVIRFGIEALVKAVVFYYFTVAFVDSEARLKKFIAVFVGCQLFRVIEPLYLHVTEGYWGSIASMANWEYLNRLSGAPSDIVNPNGLAFIICTVLPFLWFAAGLSWIYRMIFLIFAPLCVYALMLTGSRTGLVGLIIVTLGILAKAKRRFELAIGCALIAVLAFPFLSDDMQDRYLSLVGLGAKNEATFEGRITGVITNFEVALRRPVFGHGLGTSLEANANFGGIDKPAHNLYAEAAIELGFIGMVIFIFLIVSIFEGFRHCRRAYINQQPGTFLWRVVDAMQVWLLLNIAFSFASYGVTSYEWYLLGGLAVVLQRLVVGAATASNDAVDRDSALHVAREPSMLPEKQRGQTL
jgi:O-antigen ligase